ncbi:MAG: prolyl aminopeptidase [Nitrospirae bacterium]|nr:MAG: prolyl aminopeptidase [Nitrospirota bacterium]
MRGVYPEIEPYRAGWLEVEPPHRLYYEECGNPEGTPVLFVHGGPGAGCDPWCRRLFDPAAYRICLLDQRGAGRSTPHASLEANTTAHLVADLERLRRHLGIDRWVVFGGSWGSTLSLVYAQAHPERVAALILRGIFLCRPRDIRWFYQEGASRIFPDAWEDFLAPIPEAERGDLVAAYHRRLTGDDPQLQRTAARAWSEWEGRTSKLLPSEALAATFTEERFALALARIECHYFHHDCFLEEDQILRHVDRIRAIPAVLVQGRYDLPCPMEQAWALHRAWPEAELVVVPDAGHSATEPAITDALVRATDRFRGIV